MTPPTSDGNGVKGLVQQHWNGRAATFDDESQHGIHSDEQHDRWITMLRKWTSDEHLHVLDVGCGTGVISLLLTELGHDVVGVDFATEMLKRARSKAERSGYSIELQQGDAEALPMSDDTFELLAARHLLWTLPNPSDAIQEWHRVVEPGGRILLIEGYWNHGDPREEYEHVHNDLPMYDGRPPEKLQELLLQHEVGEVTYEPLMDATFWGREPHHKYYIMSGKVPRC